MRIIGLDIHRAFAEAVAWDDGKLKRLGRVDMRRPLLEAFAKKLSKEDVVVVEATGNAASVAAVIAPHVKKVVIANPKQVRVIAHVKIKTDAIDASVLAQISAGRADAPGFLNRSCPRTNGLPSSGACASSIGSVRTLTSSSAILPVQRWRTRAPNA